MTKTAVQAILLLLLVLFTISVKIFAMDEGFDISVDWIKRYKFSFGDDKPYCVAERGSYIYVTGVAGVGSPNVITYILKIDKASGRTVKAWSTPGNGCIVELHDCGFIGRYLYVVGTSCAGPGDDGWLMMVFNEDLEPLIKVEENPTRNADWLHALVSDGRYVYIAGAVNGTGGYKRVMTWLWRVEKRDLDLGLVRQYTSSKIYGGRPYDIGLNSVTGDIWVVGADRKPHEKEFLWSILILDKDLNEIKMVEPEVKGQALTICFDRYGYAYVGGDEAIMKIDSSGSIVSIKHFANTSIVKSICIDNLLFVVGDTLWRDLKRHQIAMLLDTELNILALKDLHNPEKASSSYFDIGSMAIDSANIYVAGYEESIQFNETFCWVLYKLFIKRDGATLTFTVSRTEAAVELAKSTVSIDIEPIVYVAPSAVIVLLSLGIAIWYNRRRLKKSR